MRADSSGTPAFAAMRRAISRLDLDALGEAVVLAGEGARSGEQESVRVLDHASAWLSLARGELEGLVDRATALESEASRARHAELVIDAASLAALAALSEGQLARALTLARRASRMARTEALPESEQLANAALARVRRHAGRPYLTTRIVVSLARVAAPEWLGWLALELELAGAGDAAARARARAEDAPSRRLAESVTALFDAAGRGDRVRFDAAVGARREARAWAPMVWEVDGLVRAIDPSSAVTRGDSLDAFLRGEVTELPGWLSGPAGLPPRGAAQATVRVLVAPGRAPRRVLAIGRPLASDALEIGREAGAKQERRETALAILALAGSEGLVKEELFRAVWGFAFVPHLHQGVFDVLLHRVRTALEGHAELTRSEGRIALVPRVPLAILDPRAERSLDDRVLASVSARGSGSRAREIAEDLDVPLRTVQAALGRLVESGDCLREGEGQGVVYRVEDTTFREATE